MESVLMVVHVVIAVAIVGLIMLQQGKGAEMGASFGGGSSQTVFGPAGTGNFFSRLTAIMVAVFFATSVTLAVLSKERIDPFISEIPVLEEVEPMPAKASGDVIPEASDAAPAGGDTVPQAVEVDQVPQVKPE